MDTKQINAAIEGLKNDLGEGLLSCDVWITGTGQAIATYNGGNAKATALFDQITSNINKAIEVAEFPKLNPYYLFNTEGGVTVLVLVHKNLQMGVAVEAAKTQLGLFLNIAVPNVIAALEKAV